MKNTLLIQNVWDDITVRMEIFDGRHIKIIIAWLCDLFKHFIIRF